MKRILAPTLSTLAILLLASGCGLDDTSVCQAAADHLAACTGEAPSTAGVCDPSQAAELLELDCAALEAGKADGWWAGKMCSAGFTSYCEPFDATVSRLPSMVGTWERYATYQGTCRDTVEVVKSSDRGPTLRLEADHDGNWYRAYDRADFTDINGGETCDNVEWDAFKRLKVCHESVMDDYNVVRHRVWAGERVGITVGSTAIKLLPAGSSKADQTLSIADGKLTYEYRIDGELYDRCVYVRAARE